MARSRDGYRHREHVRQADGSVLTLCGNLIVQPHYHGAGAMCPACEARWREHTRHPPRPKELVV